MIGMYFNKMRRAETLVARLAGGTGATTTIGVTPAAIPSTAAAVASTPSLPTPPAEPPAAVNPEIAPSKPNSFTGLLRVARIFDETATVKTFRLIDPLFGKLPFNYLPGQFLTVTVTIDGQAIKRSYTISSSPTERDYCEITVKREAQGAVSRFLHDQVHEDDTLQVTAPSGRFTFVGEEATSIVLIGGGVGVTPMMSVARYLTKRSWIHDIYFVFAVRGETDIIFREELDYLQHRYRNLHVTFVAEEVDPSDARYVKGRITREVLETRIPDLRTSRIHICGPPPMMNAVKALLTEIGVPPDQIRTEVFQGKEPPRQKLETLPAADTKVAVVTFAKSNRTAMLPPTKTVLEASEDVGVNIEYSCRIGICGVCRTKLLSGAVTQEVQDGLEPGDTENNIILACQAKSTADVSVDA
jgi:ferredoxin-NADP reductase